MFRSLAFYNFRVWFVGSLVTNIGMWMQTTAQAWVVLTELTDNDAAAMGIAIALQFLPHLLLLPVTGWMADRFDRRRYLLVTQSLLGLIALSIAVLLLTGAMTLPLMLGLIFASGVVGAFETPVRQVFVTDIVPHVQMSNAVALNSASINGARLVGPAAAGLLLAVTGSGWVFLINALTFGLMLVALAMLRPAEMTPQPPRNAGKLGLLEGFSYVRTRSDLLVVFAVAFLVGSWGINNAIYFSTMSLEFGTGSQGFGLLTAAVAIGALAGSLFTASRKRALASVIVGAAGLFGLGFAASALMPTYWLYAATLVPIGFAMSIVTAMANAYTQANTDPATRGRVLAIYMVVIIGGGPPTALLLGWLAELGGPRAAVWSAAVAGIVAFAIGAVWLVASGRVRREPGSRFRLTELEKVEAIQESQVNGT